MATIQVTPAGTGQFENLEEDQILYVMDDTLGSKIFHLNDPDNYASLVSTVVNETQTLIRQASDDLIKASDNDGDYTVNRSRVVETEENSTGAVLYYDVSGMNYKTIQLTDSESTINKRGYERRGYSVFEFDDINVTNNEIEVKSSEGDVTGSIAANDVLILWGTGSSNDSIYTVSSSSHSGNTTVTVNENLEQKNDETGFIAIKP